MKPLIAALLLMPTLSAAAGAQAQNTTPAPNTQAVAVDPSIQFQPFQGWGTSLAWWAKVVGGYPEPARSEYIDKTFDVKKGLGLNVVRYNIGGGENPKYLLPNKQFLEFRTDMPGFQPEPGKWDWDADKEQRWVLRAAIAKGANHLEAFSNSPPYWMTKSGSVTGNHPGQGSLDNLKPEYDRAFADYLAAVVQHFRDEWKINFRDIDPLNEPIADWWKFGNHQEGCTIERPHQVTLVKETAAALKRRGIRLPVSASDESLISHGVDTLPFYDAAALGVMDKLNVHSYGGGDRVKFANYALSQGKDLWLSEYGDGDASGMATSRRILEDIHGLHPSSWCYWQVVDNSGGWGFLKNPMLNHTDTAYETNRKYFVMGQYSKFIRPGFRFIASGSPDAVAALDAKSRTLVIVATNSKDEAAPMRFDLSRFTSLGAAAQVVRTSPSEQWASLPALAIANKVVNYDAPPQSVTTLVVQNAVFKGEMGFDARKYLRITNAQTSTPLAVEGTPQVLEGARRFDAQWNLIGEGSGVYRIVNRRSGLALDVSNASKESGGTVISYSFNGGANQLWKLQRVASGAYKIANVNSGLLLSFGDDGKSLVQKTDGGNAAQTWKISEVPVAQRQSAFLSD